MFRETAYQGVEQRSLSPAESDGAMSSGGCLSDVAPKTPETQETVVLKL